MNGDGIVSIDRMAYGGAGVGRYEGKACFVPLTAPGDRAEIRIVREKPSYLEGRLCGLVDCSSQRVDAPCPVFGDCGGCNWQHLAYQAQLDAKHAIVSDMLWRFGRIDPACIDRVVSSPEEYGYRARVQFKVRSLPDGVHIGFYRTGSHFVVASPGCCRIASPVINRILSELPQLVASLHDADRVPQIDISVGESSGAILIIHYLGADLQGLFDRLLTLRSTGLVTGLFVQRGRKETLTKVFGDDRLSYRVPTGSAASEEMELTFGRGGFSQVNYHQNKRLVQTVCEWSDLSGTERVLDLFCGNGNFTLPLSRHASYLLGIEGYAPSLHDARYNAGMTRAGNVEFRCGDAATLVNELAASGEAFDLIVMDPPRTGAKELLQGMVKLAPQRIIYVSCDPATLARDAGTLARHGFRAVSCRIHDMFPQTYHVETVTLLERC